MKKILYCITDGKIGHVRQTEGLALALQSIHDCEIQWISAFAVLDLLINNKAKHKIMPKSIVIGTGHRTHFALLYYKIRYQARTIAIMKPSLPRRWFDFCIIPKHDNISESQNVLLTEGAMNALSLKPAVKREQIVILIGGPSQSCDWNNEVIYGQINSLLSKEKSSKDILLSTSRRTPIDFLKNLPGDIKARMNIINFKDTDTDWLPRILLESSDAWVTEESISMIYESLSAGCQTKTISVAGLRGKIARNLQLLRENNKGGQNINTKFRLNESYRIAQKLTDLGLFNETTTDTN